MKYFIGVQLQAFKDEGSLGVVNDATFINCYWPLLPCPTRLFADGSSGIKVMGRTPRNVWFPDDIEFLPYYPDALAVADQAVLNSYRSLSGIINLSDDQAALWKASYDTCVAALPVTSTVINTNRNSNFILKEVDE